MRALVLAGWLFALLICASIVLADGQVACTDSDDGPRNTAKPEPYIEEYGSVKYGLTEKSDECVSGPEGYHLDPSPFVREYYCGNVSGVVQRAHEDYDCTRYGYTKCDGGRCVGKEEAKALKQAQETAEPPRCGDKKVQRERGEQCDPPDAICNLNGKIGICQRVTCTCKLYEPKTEETLAQPEVKENRTEQKPAVENRTVEEKKIVEAVVEQQPVEEKAEEPVAVEKRRELPETAYEVPKSISFTRAVTNAVKKFFGWLFGWV